MWKPGDSIDRYQVEGVLGQGGMGCVYLAHDTRLDRRVAVKVVLAGDGGPASMKEATARLVREARAAAALDHPNAVSIYDVGEIEGSPYIVMELIQGKTLRSVIDDGKASMDDRVRWLVDAARALGAAHKRGLVHRDVKPENVMVRDDGVVKVLDFGIAKRSSVPVDPSAPTAASSLGTLTVEGSKIGTPLYMSPEQIRGEALDGRADQFTWGVVAYEVVTGKVPWKSQPDALAIAAAILTQAPDSYALRAAGAPPEVKTAILRALKKDPNDRFASMDELIASLSSPERDAPPANDRPRTASKPPPPAQGPTALQRFSTDDMKEVLQRALERQSAVDDGKSSFDELVAAAREVGVDEATLHAASRELRARGAEQETFAAYKQKEKKKLTKHAATYGVMGAFFLVLNLLSSPSVLWFYWPLLGWGIGLAMHAVGFFLGDEDDWREHRDKEARKRQRRERRAKVVEKAIDEGVSAILAVTSTKGASKVRVANETPAPSAGRSDRDRERERARDAEREAEREAEAAAEAEAEARRARR